MGTNVHETKCEEQLSNAEHTVSRQFTKYKRQLFQYTIICNATTPINGLFSRTTWVSRYQKGKTSLDLNEALWDLRTKWQQLNHMRTMCTSLQTDNYINISSLNFYRPGALSDTQPTVTKALKALLHYPRRLMTYGASRRG